MPDPLALDHQTVRAVNGPSACFLRRESQEDYHVLQKTIENWKLDALNQVDASALGRWTAALDLAVFSGAPSNMVASVRFVKLVRVIVRWATLSRRRPRRRPKLRDHPRGGQVTPWRQASRRHNRRSELAGAGAAHETGLRRVKPPADLVNHPLLRSCTNLTQDLPSKACKPVVEAQPVAVFRLAAPVMQLAC
ncbi:hypothetical protein BN1723_003578 [Verticillium longisporum]|uniref:Uncharacterized protein n=1 Tax=Verticillium longisporum TaxID=100787 RepID=A0A0G4M2K1_VERLO|nr:hypothetical protein BN1723_003578 [Verticillium longisporum]CRK38200.1 hypothetical protein BN1708_007665 [Verticillium longisporum]